MGMVFAMSKINDINDDFDQAKTVYRSTLIDFIALPATHLFAPHTFSKTFSKGQRISIKYFFMMFSISFYLSIDPHVFLFLRASSPQNRQTAARVQQHRSVSRHQAHWTADAERNATQAPIRHRICRRVGTCFGLISGVRFYRVRHVVLYNL